MGKDGSSGRSGGITFGPEDVEGDSDPQEGPDPTEGFEAQAPDGRSFAVTRGDDGSLVYTDPASGEQRALPADFVADVDAATAGDPALGRLVLRIAVETSLIESGGFAGEGTSEAERRQTFARLDAAILEQLGPDDGANTRTITDLRRALQRSLRATNDEGKRFHIAREALPEVHRAAVLESAKRQDVPRRPAVAESWSDLAALSRRLEETEKRALDRLLTEEAPLWLPQPGPQTNAFLSEADFLFYGGAAGGGKTDLAIGLALTAHRRSIIFRREYAQLQAIVDRTAEVLGGRAGYNGQNKIWRLPDRDGSGARRLELGACQHPGDEQRFQGRPHDLKVFDEVAHFLESQFRFLCGWNRTTVQGQRCRVVATGNPPTDAEGEWVVRFWAPWLDPQHPNPALPGELRWFAVLNGEDREVGGPAAFAYKGETVTPKSRSFIPSRVEDNLFLVGSGYKAMLQALPEPLRSQMLKGDFAAGQEDDPWQVIPTAWIAAAQARWRPEGKLGAMDALGVDVARGGRDRTILSPRYGTWFAEQEVHAGKATPDGPAVAALIVQTLRDGAPVQIDIIGPGASVYDHLVSNEIQAVAMNGAEGSTASDRSGKLRFANKRAEWWWAMREALDPSDGPGLALPPERALLADLAAPRWKLTARGVLVEAKEEIVKRLGRSPDRGDAAVYALKTTPRRREKGTRRYGATERAYDPHRW